MTDRYGEPDEPRYEDDDVEDANAGDVPTTRLSPTAREHLAHARATLARPTDPRRP